MKQQILAILDKSTNNGMKAEEIMELLHNREADVSPSGQTSSTRTMSSLSTFSTK